LSLATCHAGFSRRGIDPVGETSIRGRTPLDGSTRSLAHPDQSDGLMRDHCRLGRTRCAPEKLRSRSALRASGPIMLSVAPFGVRGEGPGSHVGDVTNDKGVALGWYVTAPSGRRRKGATSKLFLGGGGTQLWSAGCQPSVRPALDAVLHTLQCPHRTGLIKQARHSLWWDDTPPLSVSS